MGPGQSSRSVPINMHYNLAQGVLWKGYPISLLKVALKMSECLGWCNAVSTVAVQKEIKKKPKKSFIFWLKRGNSKNESIFFFLIYVCNHHWFLFLILFWSFLPKEASLLGVNTPTYWLQTHLLPLYCIGYLYGNAGVHVSFYYFIFLFLLITTLWSSKLLLHIKIRLSGWIRLPPLHRKGYLSKSKLTCSNKVIYHCSSTPCLP